MTRFETSWWHALAKSTFWKIQQPLSFLAPTNWGSSSRFRGSPRRTEPKLTPVILGTVLRKELVFGLGKDFRDVALEGCSVTPPLSKPDFGNKRVLRDPFLYNRHRQNMGFQAAKLRLSRLLLSQIFEKSRSDSYRTYTGPPRGSRPNNASRLKIWTGSGLDHSKANKFGRQKKRCWTPVFLRCTYRGCFASQKTFKPLHLCFRTSEKNQRAFLLFLPQDNNLLRKTTQRKITGYDRFGLNPHLGPCVIFWTELLLPTWRLWT